MEIVYILCDTENQGKDEKTLGQFPSSIGYEVYESETTVTAIFHHLEWMTLKHEAN